MAQLFKLAELSRQDPSILPEAQRVQGIVARADFTIAKASIAGTKFLLQRVYGYGASGSTFYYTHLLKYGLSRV
jgi:4-hydroxy-2-oxoglutarate aldolase